MLQYNSFDEAFRNNNNDDLEMLDKMARELNNKNKNTMMNNAINNKKKFEKETLNGIDAYYNDKNFCFAPNNNAGDFNSGLPTPLQNDSSDISDKYSSSDKCSLGKKSSGINSLDFMDSIDDKSLSSEYTLLPKKKKKHLRLNTKHLQHYSDKDDKLVLEHIKKCKECKNNLINLLKNDEHIFNISNSDENNSKKKEDNLNDNDNNINYKEIKEIVILIIIGIIIIFIIDIFLR